ncbi:type II toxin-antitoxin system death-on-curing family toxin [Halosimplex marinum]|uniref:type II toxin-antitoxin system death-on-curing family toxin n=1 Tax=Halosimplex marinum TaxID=3396620 RepID=UPI003F56E6C8
MSLSYPTVDDVLSIHEQIVERSDETSEGVARRGDIAYALSFVEDGHYGNAPESIHETAAHLMRLLVANHPFVDGNKRTALASVVVFYGLNGYDLDYDDEVRDILKSFATDERAVDVEEVVAYLRRHADPPSEDPSSDDHTDRD